jgi:hypothetical protein
VPPTFCFGQQPSSFDRNGRGHAPGGKINGPSLQNEQFFGETTFIELRSFLAENAKNEKRENITRLLKDFSSLATLDQMITILDTRLQAVEEQLHRAPDASDFATSPFDWYSAIRDSMCRVSQ